MVLLRVVATLVLLVPVGCASNEDRPAGADATVERIVDGDTLVLADDRRVRLVQIDAPEPQEGECFGAEATAALERLLPTGTRVRLEADPALDRVDRFGRALRYVHRNGTNMNLELVRAGAAAPWFFDGDEGRYADRLLAAARQARADRRGLWGACPETRLNPLRGLDTGPER